MRSVLTLLFLIFSSLLQAEVVEYTLSNGLHVILKPDHRAPIVISMVWYKVGSADEPGGLSGVSHALEHMMFKGTPKVGAGQFSKRLGELGGQENAFTNQDYTAYYEKISNTVLPTILDLEADRMRHLTLSAQEFSKEINVIKEERRLRVDNNPQALALERFMATAHLALPYQHPVIGWIPDLDRLQISDLRAWYQRYYAPSNAILVLVGDFEVAPVKDYIQRTFGPLKGSAPVTRRAQIEPHPLGVKRADVSAQAQQPIILLGYTSPSVNGAKNPIDPYTLEVIAGVLDAGDSGRLTESLIKKQQIAVTADAFYDLYTRYQSQFMLFAIPSAAHTLDELKQALLQEVQKLKTTPVSATLLKRVQTQLIAEKTFEQDSLFGQAMDLGLLASIDLPPSLIDAYATHVRAVTAEDILRVSKDIFCEHCLTETRLHPEGVDS